MSSNNRVPFGQTRDIAQRKTGLKINNEASSVPVPQPDPITNLNQQAKQVVEKNESYKQRFAELSLKFKSMIEDKTLSENRSIITNGIEKDILEKLVVVASDMNADDNQPEGFGGVALSMLLMKMMLIQRDVINSLLYKVEKAELALNKSGK